MNILVVSNEMIKTEFFFTCTHTSSVEKYNSSKKMYRYQNVIF